MSTRRIGLLGGSFNPAHAGHVHVSLEALKRLRLDEVWWLVSPQNPLKPAKDMAPCAAREESARQLIAAYPRLKLCDIEARLGLRYTCDTLRALQRRFRGVQFVWLMGADNLPQFHRWRRWRSIFSDVPIAVFDRAPFSHPALRARAASMFRSRRIGEHRSQALILRRPPAWCYIFMRRHPLSSTQLRLTNT